LYVISASAGITGGEEVGSLAGVWLGFSVVVL
jgi:hypothetical protein